MLIWVIALASLDKYRFFCKKVFQEHTNSHPRKSHFGLPKSVSDPRGSSNPRLGTLEPLFKQIDKNSKFPKEINKPRLKKGDDGRDCNCKKYLAQFFLLKNIRSLTTRSFSECRTSWVRWMRQTSWCNLLYHA